MRFVPASNKNFKKKFLWFFCFVLCTKVCVGSLQSFAAPETDENENGDDDDDADSKRCGESDFEGSLTNNRIVGELTRAGRAVHDHHNRSSLLKHLRIS
jgi:hypothetical protein